MIVWIDEEYDVVWGEDMSDKDVWNGHWDYCLADRARHPHSGGIPNPRWGYWMILE